MASWDLGHIWILTITSTKHTQRSSANQRQHASSPLFLFHSLPLPPPSPLYFSFSSSLPVSVSLLSLASRLSLSVWGNPTRESLQRFITIERKQSHLVLSHKTLCTDGNSVLTREFSDFPSPLGGRGCKQLVRPACWMAAKYGENDWALLLCYRMEFAWRAKPTEMGSGSYQRRNLMHVCFYPQSSITKDFCIGGMLQRLRQAAVHQLWSVFNML